MSTTKHHEFLATKTITTYEQTSKLMDIVRESLTSDIVDLFSGGVHPLKGANVYWFFSETVDVKVRGAAGGADDIRKYLTKLSRTNKEVALEFSYLADKLIVRIASDNGDM